MAQQEWRLQRRLLMHPPSGTLHTDGCVMAALCQEAPVLVWAHTNAMSHQSCQKTMRRVMHMTRRLLVHAHIWQSKQPGKAER